MSSSSSSSLSLHHCLSNVPDGSATTIWTASIETFDGSQIVDPVVVSNVFWTSLQAKLLSVVLGQLLATLVFGLLVTVLARQAGQLTDWVANVFSVDPPAAGFRKLSDSVPTRRRPPDFVKLLVCLGVDTVGTSSEVVPLLGEVTDVLWAPVAGLILRSLYGSNVVFVLEFAEEILPLTDFLPLATICWVVDTFFGESDLARFLQIGQYRSLDRPAASGEPVNGEKRVKAIDVQSVVEGGRNLKALQQTKTDDSGR